MQSIKTEICSSDGFSSNEPATNGADLSTKKLEELRRDLQALRKEKSKRLKMTLDRLNSLHSLCVVLGLDFKEVVNKIHPSLAEAESSKNISNRTIEQLGDAIKQLRELKLQRMQQLQDLTTSLLELWDLMDTPIEEQQIFQKVTCKLAASEDEITEPDMLSIDYINYVEAEVSRLEELKASKMKELVLKKKAELEAICRKTHLTPEGDSAMGIANHTTESGFGDAACVLDEIELKIARAKEEALCRKEILEKVEKWMAACEEESWLEKYNRDDNRYNAGRGAHLTLKRAEKARALVNKLPAMMDALASKIISWENERGTEFIYDGVRLFTMLDGYKVLRKEKELQRKRQRDQKKHQGQLLTEQEVVYGSKPSPIKNSNVKKAPRLSYGGASDRKVSLCEPMLQTRLTPAAKATPNIRTTKKNEYINQNSCKDDRPAASSSVQRKGLNRAGITTKHHSSNLANAREAERRLMRKPFSPLFSATPSKSTAANVMEDLNRKHDELCRKLLTINRTPPSITSRAGQENITPQKTPSTVSIPMQTAITPASIKTAAIARVEEELEYSFEERRARFVLPRAPLMNVARV
ncbi:65-kDa microtubule-associated protein 3-like isoform X2 [Salvia miltiorrhiza]|nr:65-kDa microtubule-associated protein 3-like isoform X2 [Salvia miltiorrhiza]